MFLDLRCSKCRKWIGIGEDKINCPKCGHQICLKADQKEIDAFKHHLKLRKQFRELSEKAKGKIEPLVHTKWGYAAFYAYVLKIENEDKPSEWWVVEMNEDETIKEIKRICL